MSDSEEEEFSDGEIEDIFGESEDEEEFEGFNFQLPDVMEWVVDDDGSVTRAFYERNPRDQFRRDHVGPTINSIPGDGKAVDFFQLFITDELLGKIATWTNHWFEVKWQLETNKHKTPFEPVTDIQELKAYFALLLAISQDIDMPRYEHYFRQDETKWLFLTLGFQRVFTMKRFSQLNRYVFFCNPDELDLENPTRTDKIVKIRPFVQHLQKVFKENFNC